MSRSPAERPLSPHLQVYRLPLLAWLSILHRMTGLAAGLGALYLVAWFAAAAAGPGWFDPLAAASRSIVGAVLLFLLSGAFLYHLCNGIRHLVWDAGYGFELTTARQSGRLTILAAALLNLLLWGWVLLGG